MNSINNTLSLEEYIEKNNIQKFYPNLKDNGWFFSKEKSFTKLQLLKDTFLHNEEGPALIENFIYDNKKFSHIGYYVDGRCHRENNPAIFLYSGHLYIKNNRLILEKEGYCLKKEWFRSDLRHNLKGPALIKYRDNYKILEQIKEHYFINGEFISSKDDFEENEEVIKEKNKENIKYKMNELFKVDLFS